MHGVILKCSTKEQSAKCNMFAIIKSPKKKNEQLNSAFTNMKWCKILWTVSYVNLYIWDTIKHRGIYIDVKIK